MVKLLGALICRIPLPPKYIPMTSPFRIETTREKCLLLVAAKLEAIGNVSVI
jgi:hypothetical protein